MSDLAIITGASSGLGRALAGSVPFPAHVVDISRSGAADDSVEHITADLSDPGAWQGVGDAVRDLIERHAPGRAVFIHAAGTLNPIGFAGEVDSRAYTDNVLLNSAAGQVLGHLFLAAIQGRSGLFDLVMITSGAARNAYPGWSSYGAGKSALDQWVRTVGLEQKERGGARVSSIAPGVVATAMQRMIRETAERDFPEVDRFHALHDDGILAEPEEAARRIWALIESGLDSGTVTDIREV